MKISTVHFIFLVAAIRVSALTNSDDVAALTALKSIWNNVPSNWINGDPCGDGWQGINCTGSRVTSISLSGVDLKGRLSSDIAQISQLQYLDLSFNRRMIGPLPHDIGHLEELTTLNVARCGFSGAIPPSIGNLTQLTTLSLNSNNFNGEIPSSIGSLWRLTWLDLSSNKLSGNIPVSNETTPGLDNLTHTMHFHFQNNQLSGSIPPQLFTPYMALIHLLLEKNQLSGTIPSSIGLAQHLEILRLDHNSLSGSVPQNFSSLTNLQVLHLGNNDLSGPLLDLTGMDSLYYVDMSNNSFEPTDIPPWFSSLPSLTTLIMENTQIQGQVNVSFFSLVQLQTVRMKNNNITGDLSIGPYPSSQLELVDLQNNSIAAFLDPHPYNFHIILVGNPGCDDGTIRPQFCTISIPSNSTPIYSTPPQNCTPLSCGSNMTSCPTCKCSYPYTGNLVFTAPSFSDLGNSTIFQALQTAMLESFENESLPVDSVSLRNPSWDNSSSLVIYVEIFPSGQNSFNVSGISGIAYMLGSRDFQPPDSFKFGPYYFDPDPDEYSHLAGTSHKLVTGIIIGAAVGGSVLLLLLLVTGIYAIQQKRRAGIASRRSDPFASWESNSNSGGVPQLQGAKVFTFEELKTYTRNFSAVNDIGSGGYGKVYRGVLPTGQLIAIKRAQHESMQGVLEFKTEIELLSRVHHKNVVSLVGFCFDRGEQMLVYEYVVNGTLKMSLTGNSGIRLDWMRRLKIAVGAARGIHYLHELANPPIIHRDIKSSNILLDDRLNAKVADFGLSKSLSESGKSHITTQVKGTMGYLDPEYYMTQRLTDKSDVYSFGVLLLELLTARSPIQHGKYIVHEVKKAMDTNKPLYNLQTLLDPNMGTISSPTSVGEFVDLALRCVEQNGQNRPSMSTVVKEIEKIMETVGLYPDTESTSESSYNYEGGRLPPIHPYSNESLFSYSI